MQLGTRVRYGIEAAIDLARRGRADPVRAVDIASATGISKGYLEGLLAALRRAGLVRAVRGPGGGWQLARPATKTSPAEIYEVLEGPTALARCVEAPGSCEHAQACGARRLYERMSGALKAALNQESLAELAGLVKRVKRPAMHAGTKTNARSRTRARSKPATQRAKRAKPRLVVAAAKRAKLAGAAKATSPLSRRGRAGATNARALKRAKARLVKQIRGIRRRLAGRVTGLRKSA
jgi:Rrf2 family iron-sulfur cluster assembly transcriptional regulator